MKLFLFSLAYLFLINFANSQTSATWTRYLGGSDFEPVGYVEQCQVLVKKMPDNTFLLVSSSASNDGFMVGNNGKTDVFVARMNYDGDTLWSRMFGGADIDVATSVDVDAEGNFVICGYSYSKDGTFEGHKGENTETDGFLGYFDINGNKIWAKQYGGFVSGPLLGNDYLYDVKFAENGDIVAVGNTMSSNGDLKLDFNAFNVGWFLRVNKTGDVKKSAKIYGADHSEMNANKLLRFVFLPNGQFIAIGYQNYILQYKLWVVKFDELANKEWEKVYGTGGDIYATDLKPTSNGDIIISTFIEGTGGAVTATHNGGLYDAWVIKIDTIGNIINQKCFGGSNNEVVFRMEKFHDNFLILGQTNSFDGYAQGDSLGMLDMWMLYIDSNLNDIFSYKMGGDSSDSFISAMFIDEENIIAAGKTSSSKIGFDSAKFGKQDIFLAKLHDKKINTSVEILSKKDNLSISFYPNPVSDFLICENEKINGCRYSIYSTNGQKIEQGVYSNGIDTKKLESGSYILEVFLENKALYSKFIK